ncbi:cytosol aminopeptidase [Corynebacterium diphtheriae]|uniref:Probable cytosol aminopeptidase n=1 Tax=Corynebacterium diphtheriae TaxID=1717 RepID=A0A811G597_CORDP|nr:leucyl aminopeptidase [Corynebacterium diphtheriae]MBG9222566.1 leucyl aminopeptidase [Corynebacterium diphtheriae bv. mitis]MBG9302008.1 leucyl aminopeptidase [Corynebacterium diphtheriae bv. mitis]OJH97372.1 leucyl aminopeptidase [Corynebacterium diphtheriae]OSQ05004.1 leucyl aminopeptidase [Corynebacterium diphtheriae]OWM96157.1 aminopeptidase [Corynebacterium diphtheriae bv. mitis]
MSAQFSLPATGLATQLELSKKLPEDIDALVVPTFKGEDGLELAASGLFDENLEIAIWDLLVAVGATGKQGEVVRIPSIEGIEVDFIVGVGLGDNDSLDDDTLRRAAGDAARSLAGVQHVATTLGAFGLQPAVEGFALGAYNYTGVRSKQKKPLPLEKVTFISLGDKKAAKEEFTAGQIIAESVALCRDLVNAPSSHLYPESYAAIIRDTAEKFGLGVEILDEKKLEKQGFGGILAVGTGSSRKPRLVRLTWAPKKAKKSIALVGKGITFDTGGISLKPSAGMDDMISDMGGSATMVATIIAAARLGVKLNVTATIPLAENMPGGNAFRPGDVITHYGGITSEILNTDAEGRLVLADAIARASEDKPDYLLNVATLTGAQIVALGDRTSGVMGSDEFRDSVALTGRTVGEPAWAMPLPEEIGEDVKSPVADIRNVTGSRSGGMMAAGWYLSHFVGEGIEWAHVDIAGPAYNKAGVYGYIPKRATGVPVRTFVQVLSNLAEQ